jgi:hypothetical protein
VVMLRVSVGRNQYAGGQFPLLDGAGRNREFRAPPGGCHILSLFRGPNRIGETPSKNTGVFLLSLRHWLDTMCHCPASDVQSRTNSKSPLRESYWEAHQGRMDITKILAELRQERELIDEAILSLQRFASGTGPRVGRPPAWMTRTSVKRRGRPPGAKSKTRKAGRASRPASAEVRQ